MTPSQDRNFDAFIDRFERRIYDSAKGEWRLKLLKEDLDFLYRQAPLTIWDAGCGLGQISEWFARQGHRLTLCDISGKMLDRARSHFAQHKLQADFHHCAAQNLAEELDTFDLVLFHAVMEWLAEPMPGLCRITEKVRPGGYLSLLFYNRNAMVYSNTLKGGWRLRYMLDDSYIGIGNKLTPPNPQYPHEIVETLQQQGFQTIHHTGIRVFHDYLTPESLAQTDRDELFELEYRYCREPAFRDMGRYVHLLFRKAE